MKNLTTTLCLTIAVLLGNVSTSFALPPCAPYWHDNCFGPYTAANGNKYVAEFKREEFHGQGTYTSADSRIREGIWEANEFKYARPSPATLQKKRRDRYRAALTKCLFDNVEKVINKYAKRIVEEECRRKIKK